MKTPKNKWPQSSGARGVLFFAQLLQEMLEESTFESFRAYSLDTPARLNEGLRVIRDITGNRINALAFQPIKEELIWSLRKDQVAGDLLSEHITAFEKDVKENIVPIEHFQEHLTILSKRLKKNYKQLCEQKILELFPDDKARIGLRQVAGFYCSHLINIGYTKSYLLKRVTAHFFSRPMKRVSAKTLQKFFRELDGKNKKFQICAVVDQDFGIFLRELDVPTYSGGKALPKSLSNAIALLPLEPKHVYAVFKTERMDEDAAQIFAHEMLTSFRALGLLVPREPARNWKSEMYVHRDRGSKGVLVRG